MPCFITNTTLVVTSLYYIINTIEQQQQQKAFGVLMMMRMNNNNNNNKSRYDYEEEAGASGSGCGCFRLFCFDGQRWNRLQGGGGEHKEEESWFVKEGPKWNYFIRKLGKYCNTKKSRMADCRQYDPQSYALNFDDGGRTLPDFQ